LLDAGIEASACARKSTTSTSTLFVNKHGACCGWFVYLLIARLLALNLHPELIFDCGGRIADRRWTEYLARRLC